MKAALSLVAASVGTAVAHIHIPLQLRQGPSRLASRDDTQLSLVGNDFFYVANISVGTPAQNMQVVVSQASGDTWVRDAPSTYFDGCNATAVREYYDGFDDNGDYVARKLREMELQCAWGYYNKSTSTTYAAANFRYTDFSSYLADGNYVSGKNFTDTLRVGGVELTNYAMGLVEDSDQFIGALGLGMNVSYNDNSYSSSSSTSSGGRLYIHFLDRLVNEGKIKSPAYSIWMDDAEGKTGNLLLGAIDTSKYEGSLTRVIGKDSTYSSYYSDYQFQLNLVAVNGSDGNSDSMAPTNSNDLPFPVAISTGESLSYLPDSIASKIWDKAGATYNSTLRAATIPCKTDKPDMKFTFQFGGDDGPIISASLKHLILSSSVLPSYYPVASDVCAFGIQNSTSSSSSSRYSRANNIGSALLRSTYLVFDTANQEVAVAPIKANPGASNVVAFSGRAAAVPSAVLYCGGTSSRACRSAPSSTATTGTTRNSDYPGYDDDPYYNTNHYGMPLWEQLAIGISIPFGILTLLGIGMGIVLWRRASAARSKGLTKEVDEESVQDSPAMMAGASGAAPAAATPGTTSMPQTGSGGAPVLPPIHETSTHEDAPPMREPSPLTATEEASPQLPPRSPKGKAPEVIPAEATEQASAPLVQEQPHDHETGAHAR